MKIPYVVSNNTRTTYETSLIMKNSGPEIGRKLVAENFEWDEGVTPAPLSFCAALSLSRFFTKVNPLNHILQKDIDILMDLYPADIPLRYSVPLIKDEQYWKRCFEINFSEKKELGDVYWKGKYLSACLQKYLETQNPDVLINDEASELAALVAPYLYELKLYQLQMVYQPKPGVASDFVEDICPFSVPKLYDHLTLEPILVELYNLEEISIVFGRTNVAELYHPRFFEFTIADCESLCRGLANLKNLKIFRINRSNLDCLKVKLILQNLIKKESLEELDFNNCKIGDYGMKALGGFIFLHPNLKRVRVANNRFKEEGVQGLAYALQMKPAAPIELLDVSLNPMSLECATMFAAAFVRCKVKPQTLIVNSCCLHGASAEKMAGILSLNRGLLRLDMAANNLSGLAEETLIKALERNRNILNIDLRRTHRSEELSPAPLARAPSLLTVHAQVHAASSASSPPRPPPSPPSSPLRAASPPPPTPDAPSSSSPRGPPPPPETSKQTAPADKEILPEEIELDGDILQLLGDAPKCDTPLGPPIHKDIASRWQEILAKGMPKEVKDKILEEYLVPSNCDFLIAPSLNPETKAVLSDPLVKRDTFLMLKQKQLGVALSALSSATTLILANETSKQKLLKPISDACRILCDNHFIETKSRRNLVISSSNPQHKDTLVESGRDKSWLFGENMSEKLKAAQSIQKSEISEETLARVEELLQRNADLVGVEREPSAEIPPLYLNEPEYLIWEYNPNNPDYIPGRYPERVAEV